MTIVLNGKLLEVKLCFIYLGLHTAVDGGIDEVLDKLSRQGVWRVKYIYIYFLWNACREVM